MQVNIKNLVDDVQCYQTVRELRWPDGVACSACQSVTVQVVEIAITPPLAPSERLRGAETEPLHHGEPLHTRR